MFVPETDKRKLGDRLSKVCNSYQLPSILEPQQSVAHSNYTPDQFKASIFHSPTSLIDSPSASVTESTLVVGQGITNNSGIPLGPINKIPSYQWSFKHEESDHHHNKGKNILNGLGTTDSISLLAGTSINSTALNSRLMRLPILNNKNKHKKRSMLNGLPYYDKSIVDKQIRALNLKKTNINPQAIFNASHFSTQFNETVDDIEFLHGQVVLNQFLNNKRIMRNYQWMEYYQDISDSSNLVKGIDTTYSKTTIKSVAKFERYLQRKDQKINEMRRQKMEKMEFVKRRQHERMMLRERKEQERRYKEQQKEIEKTQRAAYGQLQEGKDDDDSSSSSDSDSDSDDELNKEEEELQQEQQFEDEIEVSDSELGGDGDSQSTRYKRFSETDAILKDREMIIEKSIPTDDKELFRYQSMLFGINAAHQMQADAKMTNGIINTNVVRIRRRPNPNALGYSNIRRHRPPFAA